MRTVRYLGHTLILSVACRMKGTSPQAVLYQLAKGQSLQAAFDNVRPYAQRPPSKRPQRPPQAKKKPPQAEPEEAFDWEAWAIRQGKPRKP